MSTFQDGRDAGLWGDDGIPYDIADGNDISGGDEPNALSEKDFMNEYEDLDSDTPYNPFINYVASQFSGMRDTGRVENFSDYTIAEYEYRALRLEPIAKEISKNVLSHFVLYDYKGSIQTNNSSALQALQKRYGSDIEIDGDVLFVSDNLITISENIPHKSYRQDTITQYWHMQLHPNDQSWGRETELLEGYSIIGHGKSENEPVFSDFRDKMKINDIVLIKNGGLPIALVQVTGKFESLIDNQEALDWFKYRRKVKVLSIAPLETNKFPAPRGTLSLASDNKSPSYIFIDNWYKNNRVVVNASHFVAIPKKIEINNAKPAFGVEAIAQVLSSIIINIPDKSGMMIGIFGKWGRGKTYLVNNIWENIKEKTNYKRVNFSAWKYQDTKESWAYLYENMMDQYLSDSNKNSWAITKVINRYKKLLFLNHQKHKWFPIISFSLLISLSITWVFFVDKIELIKFLISSLGMVFLIKACMFYFNNKAKAIGVLNTYLNKQSYSNYLGMQAEVENELECLMKAWIPNPNESEKVLLFVDDIDRCDIDKVVGIIDGLRVILDNPEIHKRLLIITAIDEGILREALEAKYQRADKTMVNTTYQEYLEKVFIIGLKLNKLEHDEIAEYLEKILPEVERNSSMDSINENKISNIESQESSEEQHYKVEESLDKQQYNTEENSTEQSGEDTERVISLSNKSDFELTVNEKEYLIISIKKLREATPRKIKIFYYKYLIFKQLFHTRLLEKNLMDKWDIHCDEKIIMDTLIRVCNEEPLDDLGLGKDTDVLDALKYSSSMVSVL